MKKLSKKLGFATMMLLLTMSLTGCQNKTLKEGEIIETLPDYAKTATIDYDGVEEYITFNVDKVEIEKRETDENNDTVYCTLYKSNEDYESVEDWILYYSYFEEGGWLLEYAEAVDGQMVPVNGVPQHIAEVQMAEYSFDSVEFTTSTVNEDESGIYCECVFNVVDEGVNLNYNGQVSLIYEYEDVFNNYGRWTSTMVYHDEPQWDIVGNWMMTKHIVLDASEELQLNILSFDGTTVEYEATVIFRDKTFGVPSVEENTYAGYAEVEYQEEGLLFKIDTGWDRYICIGENDAKAAASYGITWMYADMYRTN